MSKEIYRLQQLAGILTEIKINNPQYDFIIKKYDENYDLPIGMYLLDKIYEEDDEKVARIYNIDTKEEFEIDLDIILNKKAGIENINYTKFNQENE